MIAAILFCSLAFAETKALAVQVALGQRGFSCGAIDGMWGAKSATALANYARSRGAADPVTPEAACALWFGDAKDLFRVETVRAEDIAALVTIPKAPSEKAKLDRLGYETLPEMYAERGHLSVRAFLRMNPGVDWANVRPGLRFVIPDFPPAEKSLKSGTGEKEASRLVISLSRYEIRAYGGDGTLLASFPCSIARDKAKVPQGELKIVTRIPDPNYTYSPDLVRPGVKASKHILMAGPNNPVGIAWMGLSLPGFGIHGTPTPETIGRAESHGCFRLANWDAARLFALVRIGTRVEVVP